MKSEHRHHLAENDLEHRLGDLAEKLKPYANHILFGLLGVAVLAVIAVVVFQNAGSAERTAWADYAACEPGNANQYIEAAELYPDSTMAQWAWVNAGEILLQNGVELMFTSRTVAVADLEKARDAFEEVLSKPGAEAEARERALNGLARTLEALSDNDTQPAIDAYTQLVNDFPESRFRRWAEYRIAELQVTPVKEFYGWFHEQNPDPADRPLPQDDPHAGLPGLPGLTPPLLDPDLGGTTLPSNLDDILGPADTDTETEGTGAEGETTGEATTEETGETSEGPALGPPSTEGEATETTEPAGETTEGEAAPLESDAAAPEGDDAPAAETAPAGNESAAPPADDNASTPEEPAETTTNDADPS